MCLCVCGGGGEGRGGRGRGLPASLSGRLVCVGLRRGEGDTSMLIREIDVCVCVCVGRGVGGQGGGYQHHYQGDWSVLVRGGGTGIPAC